MLFDVFEDLGVDEGWVITSNAGESLIGESIPDFVTAVFNPHVDVTNSESSGGWATPFTNVDVAIRAGRAVGQGYPVFLVVPPPLQEPTDLAGVVVAPCPLDDFDTLRLHLWASVSTLPGRLSPPAQASLSTPMDFNATSVLDRLAEIDGSQPGAGLRVEQLVTSLLSQVGAVLVASHGREVFANPINLAFLPSRDTSDVVLVELKVGHLTEPRLAEAEQQVQQLVLERRASLGLLLYHDVGGRNLPSKHVTPLVIRLSVRQLVAGLATDSLTQLLSRVVQEAIRRM